MKATLQIALMLIFLLAVGIGTLWVVSALDYEYQIAQRLEGAPAKPTPDCGQPGSFMRNDCVDAK